MNKLGALVIAALLLSIMVPLNVVSYIYNEPIETDLFHKSLELTAAIITGIIIGWILVALYVSISYGGGSE